MLVLLYVLLGIVCFLATPVAAGQTLYNGIVLPAQWPPQRELSQVPETPPYLLSPPAVIPINVGRQLFVDDFLIESTTLTRVAHRPVMHSGNPILTPGPWPDTRTYTMPFSDGVWYDPAQQLFRMWYYGGYGNNNGLGRHLSYAVSADGENWTRPPLLDAAVPNSNLLLELGGRDSGTVWLDHDDPDPNRRFKTFIFDLTLGMRVFFSPDGLHWNEQPSNVEAVADRTTMFWNPFRNVWVLSARGHRTLPEAPGRGAYSSRIRYYSESPDLVNWTPPDPRDAFWVGPDTNDPPYAGTSGDPPQLYNLDAVAYESLILGLFSWIYEDADLVELGVGFSRDGFHWQRPSRGSGSNAFIPASNTGGTWNGYNTQSAGGVCLVVGDEIWFYFTGRDVPHSFPVADLGHTFSTGLAKLRRDGFFSMDAGALEGVLTTNLVQFSGDRLFVNVDNPNGSLRVEVLDANGSPILPYTKANSIPVSVDSTLHEITWTGAQNLAPLVGTPVRFRFHLTSGSLYSFLVTPHPSGASFGYVAAGGPGLPGPIDVIGRSVATGDDQAPSVAVTVPSDGSTVAGSLLLEATASDNLAVTGVKFQSDGADLGPIDPAPPYRLAVDTNTLTDGNHQITAKAIDAAGNVGTSPFVAITVDNSTNDTALPTVAVTFPPDGSEISETITLRAAASDNVGVVGVQFKVNGQNFGTEIQNAPFERSLDTTTLANGQYTITATARDAAGNSSISDVIAVAVLNQSGGGVPLEVISVQATEITANSAVITWITTRPASSEVNYGPSLQFTSGTDPTLVTAHRVTLVGLQPETLYPFRARSIDADGNRHNPSGFSFTTLSESGGSDSNAPSVSMTFPAAGAEISDTVTLQATATDNVGVVGVRFQIDGNNVGSEDLSPPYSAALDTTALTEGHHDVWAIGRDAAGNVAISLPLSVTVNNALPPDPIPPTVGVTYPLSGSEVSGTITLQADASDNIAVAGLQFRIDGVAVGSEFPGPPYALGFDTKAYPNGSYTITAIGRDAAENVGTSPGVTIIINNDLEPPAVEVTSPASGQEVSGTITLQADASDNIAVAGLQFRIDGVAVGSEFPGPPYALGFDTKAYPNGSYTVTATGRDAAQNVGTSPSVTMIINNTSAPPPGGVATPVHRINAGGANYTDSQGQLWEADFGFNTGAKTSMGSAINGTVDDPLFRSERWDPSALPVLEYSLPVTNGAYRVNLYFAENYSPNFAVGKRVFDVQLEGQTILDNLDIFAEVGKNAALVKTVDVAVTDGAVNIRFLHGVENPKVNAIEVLALAGGPADQAPEAVISATPASGTAPLAVGFNASGSTDDGTIVTYGWNFGDGGTATGVTANHNYPAAGTYTATLTVTDNAGQSDTATATITVQGPDQTPEAVISATPASGTAPLAVGFSANGSTDDGTIVTYSWNFGDGGTATGVTANHNYPAAGTYTATLTVTDNAGQSDTATITVTVHAGSVTPTAAVHRINAGGANYTDSQGQLWKADFGSNTGVKASMGSAINGTVDDLLFRSERWDRSSAPVLEYSLPVANGAYRVNLYFAENYGPNFAVGKRVFDVQLEGQTILDNFDIFAEAGASTALVKSADVSVSDGAVNIRFLHGVENPKVNAIEVLVLSP